MKKRALPNHVHFIGICGVAMSALALAFHEKGVKVTGSDKGFYPPVSTHLKKAGISYYPGWHPEKMTVDGEPDLVIVGNVASSTNPEWLYVQDNNLEYLSYPEAISYYFVKYNSIVCAGTYGKTSSSTLMSKILMDADMDPSYMFGAISRDGIPAAHMGKSNWSVLEGDEYKSSRWDNGAKFFHYAPSHLMITAVQWDHADVYPTEESYENAFKELVALVPGDGVVVVSENVYEEILEKCAAHVVVYGKKETSDLVYSNVNMTIDGISFDLEVKDLENETSKTYHVKSPILGDFMADNITGCIAMAIQAGIEIEQILETVANFHSSKRRLETRLLGKVNIFDDIAHSPAKAKSALESIKSITDGKVVCIFEPNTGNRQQEALPGYDNAFKSADLVIIPRLTNVKKKADGPQAVEGKELADVISKTHTNVMCIEDDDALVDTLDKETTSGDSIVFLGSHGFRGMIEGIVEKKK